MSTAVADVRVEEFLAEFARRLDLDVSDNDSLCLELDDLVCDLAEFTIRQMDSTEALRLAGVDQDPLEMNEEDFNEALYEYADERAAAINNQGPQAQARYLLDAESEDRSITEILDSLGITESKPSVGLY